MTEAEKKRNRRLFKKIKAIISNEKGENNNAIFLTLTFSDYYLSRTSKETRKRYIKQYLNEQTAIYIANIDYGEEGEREHYHAIIKATNTTKKSLQIKYRRVIDKIDLNAYKYGRTDAQYINHKYPFKNEKQIDKIVNDLIKHAFKESTKNEGLIISRKTPSLQEETKRLKQRLVNIPMTKKEMKKAQSNRVKELDYLFKTSKQYNQIGLSEEELIEIKEQNNFNDAFDKLEQTLYH